MGRRGLRRAGARNEEENMAGVESDVAYFSILRERFDEAAELELWEVEIDGWRPKPKYCHDNADLIAGKDRSFSPVRGWLVVNESLVIPHSVIRDSRSGRLADITPQDSIDPTAPEQPEGPRRFICHKGTEGEFCSLKERHSGGYFYISN
jgi:hypothetical protein